MSLSTEFVFSNLVILTTKHLLNIKEAQNIKAVNDSVIKLFNANQNCLAFKETISSVKIVFNLDAKSLVTSSILHTS